MSAQLQLANQKIFDYIQKLQTQSSNDRAASYEKLKQLDVQVDTASEQSMKVRDKEVR